MVKHTQTIRPIWKHTRSGAILEILGSSRFYFSALRGGLLFGGVWGGGGGGGGGWGGGGFALFGRRCHGLVGVKFFLHLSNIESNETKTLRCFSIRIKNNLLFTKSTFNFMVDFPAGI